LLGDVGRSCSCVTLQPPKVFPGLVTGSVTCGVEAKTSAGSLSAGLGPERLLLQSERVSMSTLSFNLLAKSLTNFHSVIELAMHIM
jgi:hypothetical protein